MSKEMQTPPSPMQIVMKKKEKKKVIIPILRNCYRSGSGMTIRKKKMRQMVRKVTTQ